MRLLIFTQKVDSNDHVLGFFCGWIARFSKECESVQVICLEEGKHNLPKNVTVYSLGKEVGASKFEYVVHFYGHLFNIRGTYDRVFVHMNQEYLMLGGLFWRLLGIPVFFWRNHPHGDIFTRIAVLLSNKVFCTSKESFTARFKKTAIMPVGVDSDIFKPQANVLRKKNSICMVGRISPIKKIDMAILCVKRLIDLGNQVSLTIIGSPTKKDNEYYEGLINLVSKNNLQSYVQFVPAVNMKDLPEIYSSHEICLNLTDTGSFDKTIVESVFCGLVPVVSNASLRDLLPAECTTLPTEDSIVEALLKVLNTSVQIEIKEKLKKFAENQSLKSLTKKLFELMRTKV